MEDEREVLAEATRRLDVIGLRRLASLADIDSSYLAKVLKGKRKLSPGLLVKLRTAFAARQSGWKWSGNQDETISPGS